MTINEIWEQAKILSPEERDELVRRLLSLHTEIPDPDHTHDILEFEGIAAHLTDDEDPQVYVNRIRDEWDNRS